MEQKVAGRSKRLSPCHPTTGKLSQSNLNKCVTSSNQGRLSSERGGMGFAFHPLCPKYNETLNPTAITAIIGYGKPLPFTFYMMFLW